MKNKFINSLIAICILATFSCKKEKDATDPAQHLAQEQITTVILKGIDLNHPSDPAFSFSCKWEDLDGAGGNTPKTDTLSLDTGKTYRINVVLLDKTKTPWDTISQEVEERKNVHQFFYTPSTDLKNKMKIVIQDYDNNTPPLPVGLVWDVTTVTDSSYLVPLSGFLNMVLSHYDGIPKSSARSPESDIDINFPVKLLK
jgi:hypothetical protein